MLCITFPQAFVKNDDDVTRKTANRVPFRCYLTGLANAALIHQRKQALKLPPC